MFAWFVVSLLFCSVNLVWSATPYKDCGSTLATIQAFEVTDCTAAPCKLIKGHTYAMNLTFQAKEPSKSATLAIHGMRIVSLVIESMLS